MYNPLPTIGQLEDLFRTKSVFSDKQPTYYETLPLLKKIDYLHKMIKDEPHSKPEQKTIKRINDLKEELLELKEHPEMIPKMLRDEMLRNEMIDKISLLITYISRNNEMSNNQNSNRKKLRTRGGRYRNKRRRTRKYKW